LGRLAAGHLADDAVGGPPEPTTFLRGFHLVSKTFQKTWRHLGSPSAAPATPGRRGGRAGKLFPKRGGTCANEPGDGGAAMFSISFSAREVAYTILKNTICILVSL